MRPSVEVAHIEGYRYGCADPHDTQPTTRVHRESGDSCLEALCAGLVVLRGPPCRWEFTTGCVHRPCAVDRARGKRSCHRLGDGMMVGGCAQRWLPWARGKSGGVPNSISEA